MNINLLAIIVFIAVLPAAAYLIHFHIRMVRKENEARRRFCKVMEDMFGGGMVINMDDGAVIRTLDELRSHPQFKALKNTKTIKETTHGRY